MVYPETTRRVPLSFVRHQRPMLAAIGRIALGAVLPFARPKTNPSVFLPERRLISAPSDDLATRYAAWSGTPDGYSNTLPPHMIAQWSIPLATTVLRQTKYNLATIINQGVSLRINGDLPRGVPLQLGASITRIEETAGRARVSVALTTGTQTDPTIIEAVMESTFPLPGAPGEQRKTRPQDVGDWDTIGSWRTSKEDGLNFALLTGDFNPIHWIGIAGKVSPFKTTVLQGFGMMARTFEALDQDGRVDFVDVRFLKPVTLPSSDVAVQISQSPNGGRVRVLGPDARLHLAGTYNLRAH